MKNLKDILIIFIFFLFLQVVFSENIILGVEVKNTNISKTSLSVFKTNLTNFVSYSNILEKKIDEATFVEKNFNYSYELADSIYQVFLYPTEFQDYVLEVDDFKMNDDINLTFKKYQNSIYTSNYSCSPNIKNHNKSQITINSNLESLKIYSHEKNPRELKEININNLDSYDLQKFNEMLNDYYYPKISIKKVLQKKNESGIFEDFFKFNIRDILSSDNYKNYTILNETEKNFTFEDSDSYVKELEFDNPGIYRFRYEANIIDLKCDLNEDGFLNSTESIEDYKIEEAFEVFDTRKPDIKSVYPNEVSFDFNINESVIFQINATDGVSIDKVYINITAPDSSKYTNLEAIYDPIMELYLYNFTFQKSIFGDYNYTIFINDTSSNNESLSSKFNVYEKDLPIINDYFIDGASFQKQKDFNFTIEVVDKSGIESVLVEIYSSIGGITSSKYLTQITGTDNYTAVFNLNNNREYLYNITARDSLFNEEVEEGVLNILNEIQNPDVKDINYKGEDVNISLEVLNITTNISDNSGIYLSQINLTYPNGTNYLYNMEILEDDTYFYELELPNLIGIYNFTIIAKDNNENINDSENGSFNLVDDIVPRIIFLKPIKNTYEIFDNIIFEIEGTDNFNVSKSSIDINFDGVSNSYEMENFNMIFNYTYKPLDIGILSYSYIVEDENGNINKSETYSIEVVDLENPRIKVIEPSLSSYRNTQTIDLVLNNTDNLEVLNSTAKIYFEDKNIENITLELNKSINFYEGEYSFVTSNVGNYEIKFLTHDTSNNLNETSVFFNVTDATVPFVIIENLESDNLKVYRKNESILFQVNSTSDKSVEINSVYLNLTYNDNVYNYELEKNINSGLYEKTLNIDFEGEIEAIAYSNNSNNVFGYSDEIFFTQTIPNILNFTLQEHSYIVNEDIVFFINSTNTDSFELNVYDGLNSMVLTMTNILNEEENAITGLTNIGEYTIEIKAIDNASNFDSENLEIEVFEETSIILTASTNPAKDTQINIYENIQKDRVSKGVSNNNATTITTINQDVDIEFITHNNSVLIYFENISLDKNLNKEIIVYEVNGSNDLYDYQKYYFLNHTLTDYIQNNIRLYYTNLNVNRESNLELYYCNYYIINETNLTSSYCNTSFNKVSSSINTDLDYLQFNNFETGVYSLKEDVSSSSSSGGSSGGGGSSRSSSSNSVQSKIISIEEDNIEEEVDNLYEGDSIFLTYKDKINFLKLEELGSTYGGFNINSKKIKIFVGGKEPIDLDFDGKSDGILELNSIENSEKAKIQITLIDEIEVLENQNSNENTKEIENYEKFETEKEEMPEEVNNSENKAFLEKYATKTTLISLGTISAILGIFIFV